ncbi:Tuberculostearic acid methyltransferase UfaA1 [Golovinomyces cichoracearum]|uniref:Tuberculostearic acid methyltransferase UfaA1 n=1 Tax=Golovinomyces cichoracearum TaxID=62708 RepID=A0A420IZ95_9PEZI|nr:Tuberculostearic acid methyltransferase UfaA1 [Golovinomyces cichoracearum]
MTAYLPALFTWPWVKGIDVVRGVLDVVSWGPAISIARVIVCSLLSRIQVGHLEILDQVTGETMHYGQKLVKSLETVNGTNSTMCTKSSHSGVHKTKLIIKKDSFWLRLLIFGDMGFAEAYMLGDFECDDLTKFFEIFILNREQLANATTFTSSIAATVASLARNANTLSNSLLNISAHYDISNEMFEAFLSKDMTYSCPIWKKVTNPADEEESLEEAQMTKLNRFIQQARIKQTDHVLEIGTGWGSFAIEAVRKTGCRVTSLTLSAEQKKLAEERIEAVGYQDKIKVLLMDYRALPIPDIPFDKVVSIEMLEAVGKEYLETYFSCIHKLLSKNGIAVFQCITMPEGRYENYAKGEDFIRKYIFPGGHLPSISQLINNISKGSNGTLVVENIENIGGHYARTLRLWKEEFLRNFDSKIKPALVASHKAIGEKELEVFRRKWEYYFVYCEAGFATKTLGDVIITVGREGAMELMEGIPR